ncbi:MAG TPA: Fic family protein [Acidimicrobiales bacterium]|nr:Fic family protein [Acidimicrobiales bacterium]
MGSLGKVLAIDIPPNVTVRWNGRAVEAADPAPITGVTFDLHAGTVRRTEQAVAAVRAAGERAAGPLEVVARLLLRSEGLASSAIEGLRASAADVALAEAAAAEGLRSDDDDDVASWVADNLAVVTDALAEEGTVDAARLFAWHERLMRHAPAIDPVHVGAWRDRLGWVGGSSPLTAVHVAVPPGAIDALMEDLFVFIRRDDLDAVTQAAVAHAQFETIHPFADGNGRIGRVLISWILSRRIGVRVTPPVSLEFARDIGGYQSGLTLYRQGEIDTWVAWFADAVSRSARRAAEVLEAVGEVQERWEQAAQRLRADSAARRLLPLLPAHPVLSAGTVASLLGVSLQAARNALAELAAVRVLAEVDQVPNGRGRPRRWWVTPELLELVGP